MKPGRRSYASLARRYNAKELHQYSNKQLMQWIRNMVDTLNPGQHFVIPANQTNDLSHLSIRALLSKTNRTIGSNWKLHAPKDGDWFVWYCPSPRIALKRIPRSADQSYAPPGSIDAPLAAICSHLGISEETFRALPIKTQLQKRILAGIALRNMRLANQDGNPKLN